MLGDAGYDSKKLKDKVANNNIGILLTARNKRNIKNRNKLDALKLSDNEKKLLKKYQRFVRFQLMELNILLNLTLYYIILYIILEKKSYIFL
jgi:hypothetical protein